MLEVAIFYPIPFEWKDILFSKEHKKDSWARMNIGEKNPHYNDNKTK